MYISLFDVERDPDVFCTLVIIVNMLVAKEKEETRPLNLVSNYLHRKRHAILN